MFNHVLRPLLLAAAASLAASVAAVAATPPGQPKAGPGSPGDVNTEVVKRGIGRVNAASYAYYLAAAPAQPRSVVVLLHAWGAVNPVVYGGWIEHLARRGHLVLFPGFQTVGRTRPADATDLSATLIREALAELASDPQARPDITKVMYLGHSAGSAIGLNLAASYKTRGIPAPRLVFGVMPGGIASDEKSRGILLADLSEIDPATSVATIVGDKEYQAADRASKRIMRETSNVPANRKILVRASSDDHGFPALTANLASPASAKEAFDASTIKLAPEPPEPKGQRSAKPKWAADMVLTGEQQVLLNQLQRSTTDTLDYLAYWRTFDYLVDSALAGTDVALLKNDPAFVDMGRWSDTWPVRRLSAELVKSTEASTGPAAPAPGPKPAASAQVQSKLPVTRKQTWRGH